MKPTTPLTQQSLEVLSLRATAAASLACLVIVLVALFFQDNPLELSGWRSLTSFLFVSASLPAFILFPIGYRYNTSLKTSFSQGWHSWLHQLSLALAYGFLYGLLATAVGLFIAQAFQGWIPDSLSIALLTASTAAISAYTIIQLSSQLTASNIVQTTIIFVVLGVCSSMLLIDDPGWWHRNFSYLGELGKNTLALFSITLIVAGMLFLTICDYVAYDLREIARKQKDLAERLPWFIGMFTTLAILIILMGVFPNDPGQILGLLHNAAAKSLVVVIVVMIAGIAWLLPGFNRTFYLASYCIGLSLVSLYLIAYLWLQYLNVTIFELLSFFITLAWLYLLLQNIAARRTDLRAIAD